MIKKLKAYFEYRKNKRAVCKELAALDATFLPALNTLMSKSADLAMFFIKLSECTGTVSGETLIKTVLDLTADKLETDHTRLLEILRYIASLPPEDLQKIVINAMVETNPTIKDRG